MTVTIHHGDCIAVMKTLADNSVDAVVTDPPYELGFMGRKWDSTGIANNPVMWAEALRVLKPGGHLLAFGGTRTFHRMAVAIEDAGFEIRDQIGWVYATGFPKSLDVAKAIDKAAGAEREVIRQAERSAARPVVADQSGGKAYRLAGDASVTAPATEAARQWQGFGTALKPSHEPVCVARKPDTDESDWRAIQKAVFTLWSQLWLMLPASCVDRCSALSPVAYGVDRHAFVQCNAEGLRSTRAALSDQMGMSQFELAISTSLNTVMSWNSSLVESWRHGSTFTTETKSGTTTGPRTLRFLLSAITPESIILAHRTGQWSSADACTAAQCLSASVAKLKATLELSALAHAIDKVVGSCLDVGAPQQLDPIVMARKPLGRVVWVGGQKGAFEPGHSCSVIPGKVTGRALVCRCGARLSAAGLTVAENVMLHGTGAINIDGCRVEYAFEGEAEVINARTRPNARGEGLEQGDAVGPRGGAVNVSPIGRWPANLILDGSDEVVALFPSKAGGNDKRQGLIPGSRPGGFGDVGSDKGGSTPNARLYGDTGSAARFFYCPKADRKDRNAGLPAGDTPAVAMGATMSERENADWAARNGNHHPTVKPTELMRYLVRLVTPPVRDVDGKRVVPVVLDPFCGSGSTLKAADLEGFDAIGIDMTAEYVAIAAQRISPDSPLLRDVQIVRHAEPEPTPATETGDIHA